MLPLFLFFLLQITFGETSETSESSGKDDSNRYAPDFVPEVDDSHDGKCGDGKVSLYSEECDRTLGCGTDCFCMEGYTLNKKKHICEMDCVYGDYCFYGCTSPNKCEKCITDGDSPYTEDCQNCKDNDNYLWVGEGNCVKLSEDTKKLTCTDFFDKMASKEEDPNAAENLKKCGIVGDQGYDYVNKYEIELGDDMLEVGKQKVLRYCEYPDVSASDNIAHEIGNGTVPLVVDSCSRTKKPTQSFQLGLYVQFTNNNEIKNDDDGTQEGGQEQGGQETQEGTQKREGTQEGQEGGQEQPKGVLKYLIELDKHYSQQDIINFEQQQLHSGVKRGMTIQSECLDDKEETVTCIARNAGFSEYVLSPRIVMDFYGKGVTRYLFVHSLFSQAKVDNFTMYVTRINHECSSIYMSISNSDLMNDVYRRRLNMDYSIESKSVCSDSKKKGFWFKFVGNGQTIDIDTCDSAEYDVTLEMMRLDVTKEYLYNEQNELNVEIKDKVDKGDYSFVDCLDSNKVECYKIRNDGCKEGSKLAKMVIELEKDYTYFLFVGLNEEYSAVVDLKVRQTCVSNCGGNGICSGASGECMCPPDYVRKMGICTQCGNGKVDEGEECDSSANPDDLKCTYTCDCAEGYVSKDGFCVLSTCGNGRIDEFEECDGGRGCERCHCVEGEKYSKARVDCKPKNCGDLQWEEGEECDGGTGCLECECQENYFSKKKTGCSKISKGMRNAMIWGMSYFIYVVIGIILFFVFLIAYLQLTKKIKDRMDEEKLIIFEHVVIPFDKNNSQYIDLRQKNDYFEFSSNDIDFGDRRPEIDEPVEKEITLTNKWKQPLHFTFHSGDYTKYEIMCKPYTGRVKPGESMTLTISLMMKCTTVLNEKVPITIRFGQLQNIIKEIKKDNPELMDMSSQESQNSESDKRSQMSSNRSESSNSRSTKRKNLPPGKNKAKITKFHVYLSLQVESALSTKLDYEEIHLIHPAIGGGTFGNVFRGDWRGVEVACKVMKTDLVHLSDLLPNFQQEAELMERIRCPYIINYIGSVITTDTLCLVTEFCQLGSLRKYMAANTISPLLKIRFCQDIAKGMQYLHENDILHRDLKTDNVLVYSKNPNDPVTCKVTDFGTSRSFIESSGKVALQNIGTPVYMAPEINRKDQMTLKSDVYSFAICMLEIWYGKDPYDPFKFPDSESILKFVGAGKRLEVEDDCILKNLIELSWNHNPYERPSFKELVIELDTILNKIVSSNKTSSGSVSTSKAQKSKDISYDNDVDLMGSVLTQDVDDSDSDSSSSSSSSSSTTTSSTTSSSE